MATISTPVYPHPRLWILRIIGFVLSFVLLVVLGICGWFYSMARSALPQLDGTVRVAGLSAPVRVLRDAHGAPTIEAANFDDLFFAQGYVTAEDRLFQMDGMRRFAGGELAEILGGDFVKHDRQQRILGLRAMAKKTAENTQPETRAHFEAYARGVNAYIETHRDRLPSADARRLQTVVDLAVRLRETTRRLSNAWEAGQFR